MYSVLRFTAEIQLRELLEDLGAKINKLVPGAYEGIRRAGDGFACEISGSNSWQDHRDRLIDFIRIVGPTELGVQIQAVNICFDVAIEPEDTAEVNIFSVQVDPCLSECLAQVGATLEFSVYGKPDSISDVNE